MPLRVLVVCMGVALCYCATRAVLAFMAMADESARGHAFAALLIVAFLAGLAIWIGTTGRSPWDDPWGEPLWRNRNRSRRRR